MNDVHAPVVDHLRGAGIRFRERRTNHGTWYDLADCPFCRGARKGAYECGVMEYRQPTETGVTRVRDVYCAEPEAHGFSENPPYDEFLRRLGIELEHRPVRVPRRPSEEWLHRQERRLQRAPEATAYLMRLGLSLGTLGRFRLGLTIANGACASGDALVCPVLGRDGSPTTERVYFNVPDVTSNPSHPETWASKGMRPATYFADALAGQRTVFVCQGLPALWLLWQHLRPTELGASMLLIASTHRNRTPSEWSDAAFWQRWQAVYVGTDADAQGDELAARIAGYAVTQAPRRVRVPPGTVSARLGQPGSSWIEYFRQSSVEDFTGLLGTSPLAVDPVYDAGVVATLATAEDRRMNAGATVTRTEFRPKDIRLECVDGKLYYPIDTLVAHAVAIDVDGAERIATQEEVQTIIVRSDRMLFRAIETSRGKASRRVWRLQALDERSESAVQGFSVEEPPRQNRYASWHWSAIERWLAGAFPVRPLASIVADIAAVLKGQVWLPSADDYTLLALLVPVSYVQAVFDSVPLVLVNGPKGTGKSTVGRVLHAMAFNSALVGAASAAAVARLIDETRGFVALDDLEGIAKKKGGDQFDDLVQALKLSYNKATATKTWVDARDGMRAKDLNFFGVKVITNTRGVDAILGSRMLHVRTRAIPEEARRTLRLDRALDTVRCQSLRNELHAWAFDHVTEVMQCYARVCPHRTDRADEISAPLRTIAALTGDADIEASLGRALARQRSPGEEVADREQLVETIVEDLVREGFRAVSPTHVALELAARTDLAPSQSRRTFDAARQQVDWVGRRLRERNIIDTGRMARTRAWPQGSQLRVYPVRQSVIDRVLAAYPTEPTAVRAALSFCAGCEGCKHREWCHMLPSRMRWARQDADRLGAVT